MSSHNPSDTLTLDNLAPFMRLASVKVVPLHKEDDGEQRYLEVIVKEVNVSWLGKKEMSGAIADSDLRFWSFMAMANGGYFIGRHDRPLEETSLSDIVHHLVSYKMHHIGEIKNISGPKDRETVLEALHTVLSRGDGNTLGSPHIPFHVLTVQLREYTLPT